MITLRQHPESLHLSPKTRQSVNVQARPLLNQKYIPQLLLADLTPAKITRLPARAFKHVAHLMDLGGMAVKFGFLRSAGGLVFRAPDSSNYAVLNTETSNSRSPTSHQPPKAREPLPPSPKVLRVPTEIEAP